MALPPKDFIAVIAPIAVKLRLEGSPIFPSVRIAQSILETGFQLHPWNNLVGRKVGSGQTTPYWKGGSVSSLTWEVTDGVRMDGVPANWRAYDTIEDGYRDQDLLFQSSRYERVRTAGTPQEQTEALYLCGYATDPAYAGKLNSLIAQYALEQYDVEEDESMPLKLEHDWQWKMLGDALDGLYHKGLITDYSWAEKAYNRELTPTELAWLNTIIYARQNGVVI